MKNTIKLTIVALLLGASSLMAQNAEVYTKPLGVVKHTLKAGQFNLVGLTLHNPTLVAGSFTTVSGTTLTDSKVNFDSALTAGKTYILEITDAADPALNGTIQEITSWSGNAITTPVDLVAYGLSVGDKYQLREVATLQQIFGTPPIIKSTASVSSSDVVWVPDENGEYVKYFYKSSLIGSGSWYNVVTNTKVDGDIPIVYTDAIMVEVKPASPDVDLVLTGSVKTDDISIAVINGFNLVSSIYPVGATLQNSGIAADLKSTASPTSSDMVWLPDNSGGFVQYYYKTPLIGSPGWYNQTVGAPVSDDVVLP
ncbi:MAG: hypothetical protein DSY82_07765, partial [Flavobacteriia bacterium]